VPCIRFLIPLSPDDEYGFSDDDPFGSGAAGASKSVWAVGAILAGTVVAWWWSVYSNTDSDQSIGAHLVVVLVYGIPSWVILFGAFIGGRAAMRRIRRRT